MQQTCTWISAEFDDQSVADFFDDQVDEGRKPEEFFRLFMHTHPGNSPQPSMTDEETFARVFGRTDWAVMFILARGGQCYARLRYNVGPGLDVELPVDVDYGRPFDGVGLGTLARGVSGQRPRAAAGAAQGVQNQGTIRTAR